MIYQINWSENKILYTTNIVKWMMKLSIQKDFIIISPLTKRSDLFDLNQNSIIYKIILDLNEKFFQEIINENFISTMKEKINEIFKFELLDYKISNNKIIKWFFEFNDQYILEKDLKKILEIINKYSPKIKNIVLVDWGFELINKNFNMLNIHFLTNNLFYRINWSRLEMLVMLDWDIPTEIIDKHKFKSWLELETKTVLTIQNINDYFDNKNNMNSFLIHRIMDKMKNFNKS